MPLPKPPAKKASLLSASDFDSQAAPKPGTRATKQDNPGPALLDLFDPHPKAPAAKAPAPAPAATPRAVQAPAAGYLPVKAISRGTATEPRPRKPRASGPPKLFVLDTNVLMHDPMSLFRFDEHDVYLPMITLEELDGHKKGMSEVSRNVRQVSRELDALAGGADSAKFDPAAGVALAKTGHKEAGGTLFFQTTFLDAKLPAGLPQGKADNQILGVVQGLREQHPTRDVVLVSKDINMRIKARALGLPAEDYFNDKTLEDGDLLYTGVLPLPADFWERHGKTMESWQQGGSTFYRIAGPLVPVLMVNQFVYLETPGAAPLYAKVTEITGKTAVLKTLKDYSHAKNAIWGVTARNREQNFALNLLMDPDCDFITLTGTAGTGKTLMTLAAGLSQVMDDRRYSEIIVTRVTVPVGEDIGFLPGTEEEKMGPWMGALDDNLEVLSKNDSGAGEWGRAATNDLVRSKIKIKSLNFMRGRTFLNKFVLIDEAQNLTPKQMKTLITRAGPGTKIVCLGNLAQIDTPYLTEGSSGLTFAVDRFKGWPHSGHVMLARGERSRLADYASDVL
ncbi:PhoH family protein [Methylibium petroleiphilum]|uniref:PhoH-like ATPase n=1 Tax=Methylibium petroleiphilum (strain ATCC BAA-1232 / LMG 22953 / PM1) TaxID=420662 RepID=A2SG10_METPP|nr:PhoH family protein [Methylibium petroleiphilum]ABM94499.1 PhoH-like ATPase [Methylibium petroleiphilum PM1]MBN9202933.1 PhoH family protein [Methylibium petroleiphilum]